MRSIFSIKLPGKVRPGQDVKASHFNALLDCIQSILRELDARQLKGSPDIGVKEAGGKITLWLKRKIRGGSTAKSAPCPFGEIYTYKVGDTTKTGIRGGWVEGGESTHWMEPYEVNTETDHEELVWLRATVTANTTEDGVATLPGLESIGEPSWESGSVEAGFPNKTIPEMFPTESPGAGVAIYPIGKVIVLNGLANLDGAVCGNRSTNHCPGSLTTGLYGGSSVDPEA